MSIITFAVRGIPATQGSKRAFVVNGSPAAAARGLKPRAALTEDNPRNRPWRAQVALAAQIAMAGRDPIQGAVELTLRFYFPRPRGHMGTGRNAHQLKPSAAAYHTTKPDLVKCWRSVEDAMKGIVWRDDSQVVRAGAGSGKYFADIDHPPGVEVEVRAIERAIRDIPRSLPDELEARGAPYPAKRIRAAFAAADVDKPEVDKTPYFMMFGFARAALAKCEREEHCGDSDECISEACTPCQARWWLWTHGGDMGRKIVGEFGEER